MLGEYRRQVFETAELLPHGTRVEEKDQWVLNLTIGIVKQAADDLRAAIRTHEEGEANLLRRWFMSEWGQLLSFGQGGAIVRRINKEEEEREQDEA